MPTHSAKSESATAIPEPALDERITAIVPARDEETTIETCVRSLARQAEIAEILVVNDQSTDRTAEIVRGLTGQIRNLQLFDAGDIPAGWLGKNHALSEGTKHATGRWLLFTDADAELYRQLASLAGPLLGGPDLKNASIATGGSKHYGIEPALFGDHADGSVPKCDFATPGDRFDLDFHVVVGRIRHKHRAAKFQQSWRLDDLHKSPQVSDPVAPVPVPPPTRLRLEQ